MAAKLSQADLVPIEEAAKELETTVISVLMHIKRKRLVGQEVDGVWQVSRKSLEHFCRDGQGRESLELCRSACAKGGHCSSCG